MGMFTSGIKEPVNELYVGETKFINEFIELIGTARDPYIGKMARPLNHDKNLIRIGEMLAEEFGFYSVTFKVLFDKMKNAFTYPITMTQEVSVNSLKPKFNKVKGYKYSNTNRLCIIVCVTSGVWFDKNIANREVAAAIMHEIGHSFVTQSRRTVDILETSRLIVTSNIYYNIILHICGGPITWTMIPQDIKNIQATSLKGRDIENIAQKRISENPLFSGILNIGQWINGTFKMVAREIILANPITKIVNNSFGVLTGLLNRVLLPLQKREVAVSRASESLSDSFATMYGLGPEIGSFLTKIEGSSATTINSLINKIPIIGFLNASLDLPVLLVYNSIETHPSTVARIEKVIKELESELKESDLDEKTKKEIRKDLEEIKKVKEDFLKPLDENKFDAESFKKLWVSYLSNKGNFETDLEKYYTDLDKRNKYMKESTGFLDDIEII